MGRGSDGPAAAAENVQEPGLGHRDSGDKGRGGQVGRHRWGRQTHKTELPEGGVVPAPVTVAVMGPFLRSSSLGLTFERFSDFSPFVSREVNFQPRGHFSGWLGELAGRGSTGGGQGRGDRQAGPPGGAGRAWGVRRPLLCGGQGAQPHLDLLAELTSFRISVKRIKNKLGPEK